MQLFYIVNYFFCSVNDLNYYPFLIFIGHKTNENRYIVESLREIYGDFWIESLFSSKGIPIDKNRHVKRA